MSILAINSRDDCIFLDESDHLRDFRDKFIIPDGAIYFMGNSLGLCPVSANKAISSFINNEWAKYGIEGYSKLNWFDMNQRVGEKLGLLIGAESGETILLESTSTSIFKCLAASIGIQKLDSPEKRVIVLERDNFPTDNYIAEGLLTLIENDGYKIRYFDDNEMTIEKAVEDDTVLVLLSAVNYRTSYLYNMKEITKMIHRKNALVIWDLSHATGAIPIDIHEINADFAVGCTYKYLNCGPGAVSFMWANKKHHDRVIQPISGWYSHSQPFRMDYKYSPIKGIKQFSSGAINIMSIVSVNNSLDIFFQTDMQTIREKSLQLGDIFIDLLEERCPSLVLVSPRNHENRGSHVSFKHENGLNITKLLRQELRIICDYRFPDIIRFAMTPLYLRFVDIWDSVEGICYCVRNAPQKGNADDVNEVTWNVTIN